MKKKINQDQDIKNFISGMEKARSGNFKLSEQEVESLYLYLYQLENQVVREQYINTSITEHIEVLSKKYSGNGQRDISKRAVLKELMKYVIDNEEQNKTSN